MDVNENLPFPSSHQHYRLRSLVLLEQNFTNRGWELNNDEHLCNIRFKIIGTNEESEQKRYEILPAPSNR